MSESGFQRDLAEHLEWIDVRLGAEPRTKGMEGTRFEACPVCRGVKPRGRPDPQYHFPPGQVGHDPSCLIRRALADE